MNLRQRPSTSTFFKLFIPGIAVIYCLTTTSCKHKNVPENKGISLVQLLVGNGTNPFRNTALGTDLINVMRSERKVPDEKDSTYLYYTMPMDTLYPDSVEAPVDTLNYYTIAYNFSADTLTKSTKPLLTEIDEYIYLANDSMAASLQNRLSDYFTNKYGDAHQGSDSKIWTFKKNGKKTSISLSDESEEYDYGKLSLVYYTED